MLSSGKVTLCRLASRGDRYLLHLAKGEAVTPRPWEEVGWTPPAPQLPGLEIILDGDMEEFAQNVMGQHYILSHGDHTAAFRALCQLLKIEFVF
jgi:L-fucose isomerase-like protein